MMIIQLLQIVWCKMLPSPIAVKVEVTGKMLKDEADTEDYENEGHRNCQDWDADIFFKNKQIK